MKKTYINPSVEVIDLGAECILAASEISVNPDKEVDTDTDDGQLGREEAGSANNIWGQGW
ncbi:MAG: hypothetical protein K2J00_00465 [Bacteroidaceae bacterium]|nr:hypothetical protein [Bacteroidaceae bacterium]